MSLRLKLWIYQNVISISPCTTALTAFSACNAYSSSKCSRWGLISEVLSKISSLEKAHDIAFYLKLMQKANGIGWPQRFVLERCVKHVYKACHQLNQCRSPYRTVNTDHGPEPPDRQLGVWRPVARRGLQRAGPGGRRRPLVRWVHFIHLSNFSGLQAATGSLSPLYSR